MKSKYQNMIKINILLMLASVICGFVYYLTRGLIIKSVASIIFVVLAVINRRYINSGSFGNIMLAGIVFAMLGDIVLEINFIGGAAVFGIGHILYFAAYCRLNSVNRKDIIPVLCVLLPVTGLILFYPGFDFGGNIMKGVCAVYAVVISLMLGKSFNNYRQLPSKLTFYLLMGSRLFFFSDFMILLRKFSAGPEFLFLLTVNTYYPGQALLSHALLYGKKKNRYF